MNDSALKYSCLTLNKIKDVEKKKKQTSLKLHNIELEKVKYLNNTLDKKYKFHVYIILTISTLILLSVYVKKKKRRGLITSKYVKRNINSKIKNAILKGIDTFEKTTLFLNSEFNIRKLANYIGTNTTYLSCVINSYKKQSFKQYLSELRINYVIRKLEEDKKFRFYSIEAIAHEAGYTSASSFTRAFKRIKKITPSDYLNSKKYSKFDI